MSKFLFAAVPIQGHMSPGMPIARRLVQLGHEVMWYSTSNYRDKIEATGARFTKVMSAKDYDDSRIDDWFPGRSKLKGLSQLKFDLKHIFFDEMIGYDADLTQILREFPADVVVADAGFFGMLPMKLKGKSPKTAIYGILPLTISSRDTAPFGFGLQPSTGTLGRIRNKIMNGFVENFVFADMQNHLNTLLSRLEAPKLPTYFANAPMFVNDLFMQGTCPSFEYPRNDLPKNVKFVGPYLPSRTTEFTPPAWWEEMNHRTVIHVTQGTFANVDFNQLLIPAIEALAAEDVLVVVTTGGKPLDKFDISLPDNVRLESFIPYHELLPHVDVMVTNAGYGGVQMAINYGVPLVTAGKSEDKPDVCARVQWAGVGVNLKTGRPTKEKILLAVREVLQKPHYKENVLRMSKEFQSSDAIQNTVKELVQLAASR